jgi:hypothetical protein
MATKRVLISIDDRLLARIDAASARAGMSRSGYLAGLADADLSVSVGPGADPAVRDALRAIDGILHGPTDR